MNIGVAVQAGTRHRNVPALPRTTDVDKGRYSAAVIGRLMTPLTQERRSLLEEVGNIRAMGVMAIRAVLGDRQVVPDERSAFFRMTLIASVVYRIAFHQLGSGRTVRIMAVRADYLTF